MHVIEPARYKTPSRQHSRKRITILAFCTALLVAGIINYSRPLPTPVATLSVTLPRNTTNPPLAWPIEGQASVAAENYGLLATHGTMAPLAIASIAKVITALCVLEKQPLALGHSGPTYTIGTADVALYQTYAAENGSLLAVSAGEHLTEYQALEALMIPSANNIADSLVRWVFGSQAAYAKYAAHFLQLHGLTQTQIGPDASGFDPGTVSTASDLAGLGQLALKNPALLEIAGKRTATLPGVGTVYNYDTILGVNGITGLKTGNNDADPGAFLFTARVVIGTTTIPVTGAIMGAPDLNTALKGSTHLAGSLSSGFSQVTIAQAGQSVGRLTSAWGASASITAKQTLQLVRWDANPVSEIHQLDPRVRSGTIGSLKVSAGRIRTNTTLVLSKPLAGPSFWWRLSRR